MKKKALLIALLTAMYLTVFAIPKQTHPVKPKRDTVRDLQSVPKRKVVKDPNARMRLQQKQIKSHKKSLKKVDSAQKKLDRELSKKDS